ncbi:restriction endonuclease subunit S, partial [Cyanobium sp. FGCU-6]|nr:restriction endonuclease subunit S [Cyanobium sp. FGCU6]
MAGEWKTVKLGEVATVRSGYAFKSSKWREAGIPVVKIANVKSGRLEMAGCSFVSESTAAESGEFLLSNGDILIAMTGYIGDVARVRKTDLPCVLNQRVGKFSVRDKERLDADFLYSFLAWAETRQTIEALGYGSAQPNVSPSLIHKVEIPLPPLAEQKAIAAVLGALDDKIEMNRRLNATLEAMARALFQSWFVDFDPVRAKLDGREPVGMDPDTAALFPEHFAHGEHAMLPVGWRIAAIEEVCAINAWTLGKNDELETLEYVEISEVNRGNIANVSIYPRGEEPSRARRRLRHGDTALSTVRPDRGSYFLLITHKAPRPLRPAPDKA